MSRHRSNHAIVVVISTTFVGLLAMPEIGPDLPLMQTELENVIRDIGWIVMPSYTLPGLIFVPFTGYLADKFGRFGRKVILRPSLVLFAGV